MSIQALSAEPLESAICCSSLAMRSLCASAWVGAMVCASRTIGEHKKNKANKQRRNFDIFCSAPVGRESIGLIDNLSTAGRGGKSKIFMDAIRGLVLPDYDSWTVCRFTGISKSPKRPCRCIELQ